LEIKWAELRKARKMASFDDATWLAAHLTERERQIIRLIALGYKSREVALLLGLRPTTVQAHRARIRHKLRIRRRWELVSFALKAGLLDQERRTG